MQVTLVDVGGAGVRQLVLVAIGGKQAVHPTGISSERSDGASADGTKH